MWKSIVVRNGNGLRKKIMDRPQRAKHYDANHEWETQFIDFRYITNICTRLILAQWKSWLHYAAKKQIWFIFCHGFINNLKRFFCVCHKQTTKSVNVSSAEQQHNKGVTKEEARKGKVKKWKKSKSPCWIYYSTVAISHWWGLSCVCGKFALIFFACSQWECVLPPSIPPPSLSLLYKVLGQALLLLRSFFYISNGTRAINCKQSERERKGMSRVGESRLHMCSTHTHTHTLCHSCVRRPLK